MLKASMLVYCVQLHVQQTATAEAALIDQTLHCVHLRRLQLYMQVYLPLVTLCLQSSTAEAGCYQKTHVPFIHQKRMLGRLRGAI